MPDPNTRTPDGLREQYTEAIRQAAHDCDGKCGMTEQECDAANPIQVGVWTRGVVSEVYGTPDALADAVLAVRDRRMEQLTAELAAERATVQRVRAECEAIGTPRICNAVDRILGVLDGPAPPVTTPDTAPAPLPSYAEISQYRTDRGDMAWAWRCWGDGTCDGHLGLDLSSERWACVNLDRHLTEDHQPKEQPVTQPAEAAPTCTATIEGPHVPGPDPTQCTRPAGHPELHAAPTPAPGGRTLWSDHYAGATPHKANSEEH